MKVLEFRAFRRCLISGETTSLKLNPFNYLLVLAQIYPLYAYFTVKNLKHRDEGIWHIKTSETLLESKQHVHRIFCHRYTLFFLICSGSVQTALSSYILVSFLTNDNFDFPENDFGLITLIISLIFSIITLSQIWFISVGLEEDLFSIKVCNIT